MSTPVITTRKAATLPVGRTWTLQARHYVSVDGRIVGEVHKHQNYGSSVTWGAKRTAVGDIKVAPVRFDTKTAAVAWVAAGAGA